MTKQSTTIDIEEKKKRAEILTRSLGPEYLNHRAGPGGGKLTYIEGKTAIELANDIFGYDGWSSEVRSMTIDLDECVNGLYTIGVSAVIRITLKEGNYHEDCGFGSAENMRSKIAALEKARKEACTDAFKRSLRMFGNAVGNCLYDKRFIQNVGHMKAPTVSIKPWGRKKGDRSLA
ncbi:hypothetical protein BX666DRAFT_1859636 [Dichotomocladium elegans]|nr:hypothetical protein BX666DRAFT_1859636 [Dichotomocladium elegans]